MVLCCHVTPRFGGSPAAALSARQGGLFDIVHDQHDGHPRFGAEPRVKIAGSRASARHAEKGSSISTRSGSRTSVRQSPFVGAARRRSGRDISPTPRRCPIVSANDRRGLGRCGRRSTRTSWGHADHRDRRNGGWQPQHHILPHSGHGGRPYSCKIRPVRGRGRAIRSPSTDDRPLLRINNPASNTNNVFCHTPTAPTPPTHPRAPRATENRSKTGGWPDRQRSRCQLRSWMQETRRQRRAAGDEGADYPILSSCPLASSPFLLPRLSTKQRRIRHIGPPIVEFSARTASFRVRRTLEPPAMMLADVAVAACAQFIDCISR